jgi:hypothetical protein
VDLQEFGNRVYVDLLASIDAEMGTEETGIGSQLEEERAAIDAFVEGRVERYVLGSRRPILEALLTHACGEGEGGHLLVVGEPGSGKSALLGKLLREWDTATGTSPNAEELLVIPHFIGVNSTDLREMLWRLCSELVAGAGLPDPVPTNVKDLQKAFPEILEKAAAAKHILVVLDALNQLDSAHGARSMAWLPDRPPERVRFVLSTIPGPVLEALRRRQPPPREIPLPALPDADSNEIVDRFLKRYRKTLDSDQRNALLGKEDTGNPLYLLTALEELRTLGIYEEITGRIEEMPGNVKALFSWILGRLEMDPGFRDPEGRSVGEALVERFCSYLCLGRRGMAQSELTDLLSRKEGNEGQDLGSKGNVAALQALLRPYLMMQGGLLDFFHGQLREAAEERYLGEDRKREAYHEDIARLFTSKLDPEGDGSFLGDSVRGLSELPYHLTEARNWDALQSVLTDFHFLERKVSEVGVMETFGPNGEVIRTYTGVFLLQDDYDHALSMMPGGDGADTLATAVILTPVDFGEGYVIRCPYCQTLVPFQEAWLGKEMRCPTSGCGGPWKVNPFKAMRPV